MHRGQVIVDVEVVVDVVVVDVVVVDVVVVRVVVVDVVVVDVVFIFIVVYDDIYIDVGIVIVDIVDFDVGVQVVSFKMNAKKQQCLFIMFIFYFKKVRIPPCVSLIRGKAGSYHFSQPAIIHIRIV